MTQKISEFKVGNIIYDVVLDGDLMDGASALGSCDYMQSEIALYDRQSEQRMEQVLYHELTHAIFFEAGFDEQDEDMVNRLGIVLHQFIKDNFEFIGHDGIRDAVAAIAEENAQIAADDGSTKSLNKKQPIGFGHPMADSDSVDGGDEV